MYKNILQAVNDLEWVAVGVLILFFAVFLFVLIRVVRTKKTYLEEMANMPLEED